MGVVQIQGVEAALAWEWGSLILFAGSSWEVGCNKMMACVCGVLVFCSLWTFVLREVSIYFVNIAVVRHNSFVFFGRSLVFRGIDEMLIFRLFSAPKLRNDYWAYKNEI